MLTRITFTPYIHPVTSAASDIDKPTPKEGRKASRSAPQNPAKNTVAAQINQFWIIFLFNTETSSRQMIENTGKTTPVSMEIELSR